MPVYVRECAAGHRTEVLRSIKDVRKSLKCPQCGGPTYSVVSPVAGIVRNPAVPRSKS